MKRFKEYCDQVGYDRKEYNPPEPIKAFYAYKAGKVIKCSNIVSAKAVSSIVETIVTNKDEIDAYWKARSDKEAEAVDLWYSDLKSEYGSNLTEAQFSIIYQRAYDYSHSDGYDSVADEFDSLYEFTCDFVNN